MFRKRPTAVLLVCMALGAAVRASALETGPQAVVRQFCQADGLGQRVQVAGWAAIAPIVAWSLEPAWDHVVLISSYEVGSPRPMENGSVAVEVRYAVIGQVSPLDFDTAVHLETVDLQLDAAPGNWRVLGPPPPPHIFAHRVDLDALRRSLESGGLNFLPNTVFVWQMFQSAGWNAAFVPSTDLLNGQVYRAVDKPKVGDLGVYLRDGTPYHVGVFEADDRIVSSTLNAGIVRTALDAFPGEMKYLRLVEPEPEVEAMAAATPVPAVEPAKRAPTPAAVRRLRQASATVKRGKRIGGKTRHSHAQPSKRKRLKGTVKRRTPKPARDLLRAPDRRKERQP